MTRFYEQQGEKDISATKWRSPQSSDEQAHKPEKGVNLRVNKVRTVKFEVQIKNNPLVKKCPTTVTWNLIEKTPNRIVMRNLIRNAEVPFCESFLIDQEIIVLGPDKPNASTCIIRQSQNLIFVKFCMVKSMIKSNSDTETRKSLESSAKFFDQNCLQYVEPSKRVAAAAPVEE